VKPGRDADGIAQTEAGHFGNCPVCGTLIDMRAPFARYRSPYPRRTPCLEILQLLLQRARIGQRCGDLQFACVQPLIKVRSARRSCGCL
jgi:hypothetical protein